MPFAQGISLRVFEACSKATSPKASCQSQLQDRFLGCLLQVRVKKHLPVLFDPLDGETAKRVLEPSRSSPVGFELHLKKPELSRLWRTMDARSTKKDR